MTEASWDDPLRGHLAQAGHGGMSESVMVVEELCRFLTSWKAVFFFGIDNGQVCSGGSIQREGFRCWCGGDVRPTGTGFLTGTRFRSFAALRPRSGRGSCRSCGSSSSESDTIATCVSRQYRGSPGRSASYALYLLKPGAERMVATLPPSWSSWHVR